MNISVPPETVTEDALLGGRVRLLQPRRGYRAALDPVLLAAAVPAAPGERVLELGSGTAAAALALAARVDGVSVTGLERDPGWAALARRSAALNGFGDRVAFVTGDLVDPPAALGGPFDHVLANPPYLAAGAGRPPPEPARAAAHMEGAADLAAWAAAALGLVRTGGSVTFIHRRDRADEVAGLLAAGAGAIVIFPLWSDPARRRAKRAIVQGRKGAPPGVTEAHGLVLHGDGGGYTAEAEAVLRDAGALALP